MQSGELASEKVSITMVLCASDCRDLVTGRLFSVFIGVLVVYWVLICLIRIKRMVFLGFAKRVLAKWDFVCAFAHLVDLGV